MMENNAAVAYIDNLGRIRLDLWNDVTLDIRQLVAEKQIRI